jgi:hypothetical protein
LLTTVTVIFEPVRLALTSTPSIAPSCEVTCPVSAGVEALWASVLLDEVPQIANATRMNTQNRNLIMTSASSERYRPSFRFSYVNCLQGYHICRNRVKPNNDCSLNFNE